MRAYACLAALALGLMATVAVGAVPPDTDREISALIDGLRDSGCRFQRNGRWYDGQRAAVHLRRKYDYLAERDGVDSTEAFIELAASRSSLSGKPYRVQCGDAEAMESGRWFGLRLGMLRGSKPRTR